MLTYTKYVSCFLSEEQYDFLNKLAADNKVRRSTVIKLAINQLKDQYEKLNQYDNDKDTDD